MPLEKQLIEIPLAQGIDTKTDPKLVQQGTIDLRNADLATTGAVKKRKGYSALTQNLYGPSNGSINAAIACQVAGDTLIAVAEDTGGTISETDKQRLVAYSTAATKWLGISDWAAWQTSQRTLISNPESVDAYCRVARRGGFIAIVNDPDILIIDDQGNVLFEDAFPTSSQTSPTVVAIDDDSGNTCFVFVYNRGVLGAADTEPYAAVYNTGAPVASLSFAALGAAGSWTSGPGAACDVLAVSDTLFAIAFGDNVPAGPSYAAGYVSLFDSDLTEQQQISATGGFNTNFGLFLCTYSGVDYVGIIQHASGTSISYALVNLSTYAVDHSGSIATVSSVIGMTAALSSTNKLRFYWYTVAGGTQTALATIGSGAGTAETMRGPQLASRAVSINGVPYVLLNEGDRCYLHQYTALPTTSPISHAEGLIARWRGDSVFPGYSEIGLPDLTLYSSTYYVHTLIRERLSSNEVIIKGLALCAFETAQKMFKVVNAGRDSISAGPRCGQFDGAMQELGFDSAPVIDSLTPSNGSGSLTSSTTYTYYAVYEWTDKKGQLHRSALSDASTVSMGGSDDTVTAVVQTARNTHKEDVIIALYRNVSGGTTFYRCDTSGANVRNANTVSIIDGVSDANIADNELIYTTGGVLERDAPPPAWDIAHDGNRFFVVAADDRTAVWYSGQKVRGEGVWFNLAQVMRDVAGGDIVALAAMDGRVFLFKSERIRYFSGAGPNALGQGDFSQVEDVATDVGCSERDSVVVTGDGIFFKSKKGIFLLDRGLQRNYIGAPIEGFNADGVRRAILSRDETKVLFLLDDGATVLAYDSQQQAWGKWLNHAFVDGCDLGGTLHFLKSDGTVWQQTSGWQDNGSAIELRVETGWLRPAGVQGYFRVYWIGVIGELEDDHTLTIELFYNYIDTVSETITVSTSAALTGGDTEYAFRVKPSIQKCRSIKVRLRDSAGGSSYENLELTGLAFYIGSKGGIGRLKAAKTL